MKLGNPAIYAHQPHGDGAELAGAVSSIGRHRRGLLRGLAIHPVGLLRSRRATTSCHEPTGFEAGGAARNDVLGTGINLPPQGLASVVWATTTHGRKFFCQRLRGGEIRHPAGAERSLAWCAGPALARASRCTRRVSGCLSALIHQLAAAHPVRSNSA
jgi:hypothetical protein